MRSKGKSNKKDLIALENNKETHSFENAGFIDALIDESFVNFNPRRDIYNVTFTFPIEVKEDVSNYIKHNGKKDLVQMIIGEVRKCQSAEAK